MLNDDHYMKLEKQKKKSKWTFDDYAFTITGIVVGLVLVGPELLYQLFGISVLGGTLDNITADVMETAITTRRFTINHLRSLSPMLFLLTMTICFTRDAIVARKTGGYKGSLFTHTFESLLEDAIYMIITTIMVYSSIFLGTMYSSWLAAPITWVLFFIIFPIVRGRSDKTSMPFGLLSILLTGIILEIIFEGWFVFPFSWLLICTAKFAQIIKDKVKTMDEFFNLVYYFFSIALMAIGILFNFWIISWSALFLSLAVTWLLSKFKSFHQKT